MNLKQLPRISLIQNLKTYLDFYEYEILELPIMMKCLTSLAIWPELKIKFAS